MSSMIGFHQDQNGPYPNTFSFYYWPPCPFRHFKVFNLVLTVDMVHEIDISLTIAQYFVILHRSLISKQTNALQMEPVLVLE